MSKHAFTVGMRVQQLCSCSLLPREYIGLNWCVGLCSWIAWNRALRPREQVVPMTLPRQRCERSSISSRGLSNNSYSCCHVTAQPLLLEVMMRRERGRYSNCFNTTLRMSCCCECSITVTHSQHATRLRATYNCPWVKGSLSKISPTCLSDWP
jgi:hypothetical protein